MPKLAESFHGSIAFPIATQISLARDPDWGDSLSISPEYCCALDLSCGHTCAFANGLNLAVDLLFALVPGHPNF